MYYRVLIALVRTNGNCPCPRCQVLKSDIHMMGGKRDSDDRMKLERKNDTTHRATIEAARSLVHEYNHAVNSDGVNRLTFDSSLVPVKVSLTSPAP
jgi:hypothetical protein